MAKPLDVDAEVVEAGLVRRPQGEDAGQRLLDGAHLHREVPSGPWRVRTAMTSASRCLARCHCCALHCVRAASCLDARCPCFGSRGADKSEAVAVLIWPVAKSRTRISAGAASQTTTRRSLQTATVPTVSCSVFTRLTVRLKEGST